MQAGGEPLSDQLPGDGPETSGLSPAFYCPAESTSAPPSDAGQKRSFVQRPQAEESPGGLFGPGLTPF